MNKLVFIASGIIIFIIIIILYIYSNYVKNKTFVEKIRIIFWSFIISITSIHLFIYLSEVNMVQNGGNIIKGLINPNVNYISEIGQKYYTGPFPY